MFAGDAIPLLEYPASGHLHVTLSMLTVHTFMPSSLFINCCTNRTNLILLNETPRAGTTREIFD
jgi:hypothetical protein